MAYEITNIEQWAASHHTDLAIAQAIQAVSRSDEDAERIWEDPTPAEEEAVMTVAWLLADDTVDELEWGCTTLRRS